MWFMSRNYLILIRLHQNIKLLDAWFNKEREERERKEKKKTIKTYQNSDNDTISTIEKSSTVIKVGHMSSPKTSEFRHL